MHNYCTRSSVNDLACGKGNPKSELGRGSFYFRGIKLWNDLNPELRCESFNSFKKKLKNILLNN